VSSCPEGHKAAHRPVGPSTPFSAHYAVFREVERVADLGTNGTKLTERRDQWRGSTVLSVSRQRDVDHVSPRLSQPFVRPCHSVS
jgi:phytoene/squalene synthetase